MAQLLVLIAAAGMGFLQVVGERRKRKGESKFQTDEVLGVFSARTLTIQ